MSVPPTGTVTFLFTDIEGSTRLAQQLGTAWSGTQARHHALLRGAIEANNGYAFQVIGDAFCAAFHTASDALAAALASQRAFVGATLAVAPDQQGQTLPLLVRVRMGIHTGAAAARPDGDYDGYLTLVRVQRIMSAAYGGQVLLSQDARDLVHRDLPPGVSLRDLGTHRLKDLTAPEHLHQLVAPDLPSDFPPLKTADHPNNLPTQLTSFIGRDAEVAEVRRLLGSTHLLTLTGAGGVGKTRLALQAAAEHLAAFPDGIWLAELAPLADPALIARAIASVAGVREEPTRPMLATLGDHFRDKSALIVLDNCEHLIAAAAQVCDTLLHAAPALRILATSREALGIAGEHAYRVPSLGLPPEGMPPEELSLVASVRLFTERARAGKNDFQVTNANALAVAQICHRLDGIPLAIELAAARVRNMTVEQIAARLDDRFRILTGGSRTALPRQQTLRALIDWSYRLLSEQEKTLLRRLSVFTGGWTLEAAESVCSGEGLEIVDVLDLLTHLVDRSLVILDETGDAPRYRMLETIRQYARDALDETNEAVRIRNRHLAYFIDAAKAATNASGGSPLTNSASYFERESGNLRSALTWAREADAAAGLRLLDSFVTGLHVLGRGKEAYEWLESLLARDTSEITVVRARALRLAGYFAASLLENYPTAKTLGEESIAGYRLLGDAVGLARALGQSSIALERLAPEQAEANLSAALRIAQETGDMGLEAETLLYFGEYWRFLGNDLEAVRYHAHSVELYRRRHPLMVGYSLVNLAFVTLHCGDHSAAQRCLHEALTIASEAHAAALITLSFAGLAGVAVLRSNSHDAGQLAGAAQASFQAMKSPLESNDRDDFDRYLALARSQSDPATFSAAFAEGYAMSQEEAIAYALEVSHQ